MHLSIALSEDVLCVLMYSICGCAVTLNASLHFSQSVCAMYLKALWDVIRDISDICIVNGIFNLSTAIYHIQIPIMQDA